MGFSFFRRKFVMRTFLPDTVEDGYAVANYEDKTTILNVQPAGDDNLLAEPQGANTVKSMRAFGDTVFTPADRSKGRRGDWIYYQGAMDTEGHWYECVSSMGWDHTLLHHIESSFVRISEAESRRYPPPDLREVTGS